MKHWSRWVALAAVMAAITPGRALAQSPGTTAGPVKELSGLLAAGASGAGPRFIAAEDPANTSRFVAAMLLPDLQLLVVAADYSAPVLLRERVLTKKYREAYQDLQSASIPDGKVVIEDLLANGLAAKPAKGQGPDAATLDGRTVNFDGQWRKAKLSESDYQKAYADAEQRYARLLGLLIAQAKVK